MRREAPFHCAAEIGRVKIGRRRQRTVSRNNIMAPLAPHSLEAQIRSTIDSWAQAIRAKDAAGVSGQQTPDFVQFDFAPPLQTIGPNPQGLQDWFATWRGPVGYELTELRVTAGEDVAFCHALIHMTGSRTDGSQSDVWFRNTLCLRKVGDAWKIAHGHESVPMYMDGSFKAAIDLKP
jgi:ketosteroid isomerase-like protein